MKSLHFLALAPALMYQFRFLNFFLNPGHGTTYNGGAIADEEQLADENLEDEDLPDEAPKPAADGFNYTQTDPNTPHEREVSEIETNDMDEK
ncbi:hypothetical protein [Emticicia sp. 21SJ11W-3]|uniref:hypothetical protein n=1 Tax=Emticicia sp. 21SJ11W-3 TaxID=2916755 RepID=UPI00209E1283|nr:hypothetical protein [Emticicia sp. 21SJ11W-3]UTA66671.1 hypothetical protein MB380_13780 [Emticicia sp. 21SJ11W-3]